MYELVTDYRRNGVTTPDKVRERLKYLRDIERLSWRKIASLDEFKPMPPGTLCAIYHGAEIPYKWREHLGIPKPMVVEPCEKCGQVHRITKNCSKRDLRRRRALYLDPQKVDANVRILLRGWDPDTLRRMIGLLEEALDEQEVHLLSDYS